VSTYIICLCHLCFLVVPHITNAIQEWVERVAKVSVDGVDGQPDVCIVEVLVITCTRSYDIFCYSPSSVL